MNRDAKENALNHAMQNQMQEILRQNNEVNTNESMILDEMNRIIEKIQKSINSITNSNMSQEDAADICAKLQADIETTKVIYQSKINTMNQINESDIILPDFSTTKRGTNWDQGNINTMDIWIKECNMQQFVYEFVLDKITKKSISTKIWILIFCAIQTLISCSNLGIDEIEHPNVIMGIKICIPVISLITYVLSHIVTIAQYEDNIRAYTQYSNDIETFIGSIISVASIKIELRPDGDEFILKNSEIYSEINRRSPHIRQSLWQQGIKTYNQYISSIENGNDNFHSRKKRVFNTYVRSEDVQEQYSPDDEYLAINDNENENENMNALKPLNQRDLTELVQKRHTVLNKKPNKISQKRPITNESYKQINVEMIKF